MGSRGWPGFLELAVGKFHGQFGQGKQRKSKVQNLRHLNSIQIKNKEKFV